MIEFSKLMVSALDQFEGEQNFSVVQFATSAQLVADLNTADEAMEILDTVQFTGGSTDHATAIRECQSSFANSDPSRQNFIMMVRFYSLPRSCLLFRSPSHNNGR